MPDGTYWHLDLLDGQFLQVARTPPEFEEKLTDEVVQAEWFSSDWAKIALAHGLIPAQDECLGWAVHPILGAPFAIENIQIFKMIVYQTIMGQFFRQLAIDRF